MRRIRYSFVLSVCLLLRATIVIAQPAKVIKVEAEGMVALDENDPIASRNTSLIEAQRVAVEKAVGVYIKADSKVEKHVLTQQTIKAHSDGRILHYDVIWQHVDDDKVVTKITAEVLFGSLGNYEEPTIEEQIQQLPADRLAGYMQYTLGRPPTHDELLMATRNPLPIVKGMYRKLQMQATGVDEVILAQSYAKTLGVFVDSSNVEDFLALLH